MIPASDNVNPHAVTVLTYREHLVGNKQPHPPASREAKAVRRAVDALTKADDPLLLNVAELGRQLLAIRLPAATAK